MSAETLRSVRLPASRQLHINQCPSLRTGFKSTVNFDLEEFRDRIWVLSLSIQQLRLQEELVEPEAPHVPSCAWCAEHNIAWNRLLCA